jgi:hypothetical protein
VSNPSPLSPTIELPPPDPESCLVTSRVSSFKGGTLIAEDVRDLDAHQRRLCDPDGYRPDRCPRCDHDVLHVHCYPERHPRGEPSMPLVVQIAQYMCASAECGATWRVLPMFLARHLWRAWKTIERVALPGAVVSPSTAPPVPARTLCRWRARLAAAARVLVVLFAASGGVEFEAVVAQVGLDASRAELVRVYAEQTGVVHGGRLAAVATLMHRLERGIRLM